MSRLAGIFLLALVLPAAGRAESAATFPGQQELAAGLACWRNLQLDCARARLQQALEKFDARRDPLYPQHVSEARFVLGLLHVARDDLAAAEREFYLLLLLVPDFRLPPGDHPPKVGYVLEQAKKRLQNQARARPAPVGGTTQTAKPPVTKPQARAPLPSWSAGAGSEFVFVFGSDAAALYPGLGAELWMTYAIAPSWRMGLRFAWARHPARQARAALQYFGTGLIAGWQLSHRPLALELLGQVLLQALGTEDRYDHWAARLALGAGLAWPTDTAWSLRLQLLPALLVTGSRASFSLVAGAGFAWHW